MRLKVSVKQPGKKHPLIDNKFIEIAHIGFHPTVYTLITAVVAQQVIAYNNKPTEKSLLPFLDKETIERDAENGKVGFGSIYNENKAVVADAQQVAVQAFEDGIFSLFVDDQEYRELHTIINLTEDSTLTFIRLTFLAGSYW